METSASEAGKSEGAGKLPVKRNVGRNAVIGVISGIGLVLLCAVTMVLTVMAGGLIPLLLEPPIFGLLGIVFAIIAGLRGYRPGFVSRFLISLGVSLLILCGSCFAVFKNVKL